MLKILFLEWSLEILSLCKEFSSDGVVGIDLAGDEILGEIPAMKGHVNAFKVCCNLKPCIHLFQIRLLQRRMMHDPCFIARGALLLYIMCPQQA